MPTIKRDVSTEQPITSAAGRGEGEVRSIKDRKGSDKEAKRKSKLG